MIDYWAMAPNKRAAEHALADWRADRLSRDDLYDHAYGALAQGVHRGFRAMMSTEPDDDEMQEVMVRAFLELSSKDPAEITSINGLVARIADLRARDYIRERISAEKRQRSIEEDRAWQMNLMLAELDGQKAELRGQLGDLAMDCLNALPREQRDVVDATIMGRETVSDWAHHRGKSHQAASKQRERALNALTRCLADKRAQLERGEEEERDG